MKTATIISIGDELLIGQTTNTNATWIGARLTEIGVDVIEVATISDKTSSIEKALNRLVGECDYVLLTGGLGPTKDDVTKHTLSKYFDSPLQLNKEVLKHIKGLFHKIKRPMLEANVSQAYLPEGCEVIENLYGTAAGMGFNYKNTRVFSMPGVPYEMRAMMSNSILPMLEQESGTNTIANAYIFTAGIGESAIADKIKDLEFALPEEIKIAYLPSLGKVKLRLTTKGKNIKELKEQMFELKKNIESKISKYVYSDSEESHAKSIIELCRSKNMKLATAESCTGGAIAASIVEVPGASSVLDGAVVAYSYEAKTILLNVPTELLDREGAVSEECVKQMIIGAANRIGADLVIASSGIAGPDGGTDIKPVGTVYVGVGNQKKQIVRRFHFGKERESNIDRTVTAGLEMARRYLQGTLREIE